MLFLLLYEDAVLPASLAVLTLAFGVEVGIVVGVSSWIAPSVPRRALQIGAMVGVGIHTFLFFAGLPAYGLSLTWILLGWGVYGSFLMILCVAIAAAIGLLLKRKPEAHEFKGL